MNFELPPCKVSRDTRVPEHRKALAMLWPKVDPELKKELSSKEYQALERFIKETLKFTDRASLLDHLAPCTWWVLEKTLDRWKVWIELSNTPKSREKTPLRESDPDQTPDYTDPDTDQPSDQDQAKSSSYTKGAVSKMTFDSKAQKTLGKYLAYFILSFLVHRILQDPDVFLLDKDTNKYYDTLKKKYQSLSSDLIAVQREVTALNIPMPFKVDQRVISYKTNDWDKLYDTFQDWLLELKENNSWIQLKNYLEQEWRSITNDLRKIKLGNDILKLDIPNDVNFKYQFFFQTVKLVMEVAYEQYEKFEEAFIKLSKTAPDLPDKKVKPEIFPDPDKEPSEEFQLKAHLAFLSRNIAILLSSLGTLKLLGKALGVSIKANRAEKWTNVDKYISRNRLWYLTDAPRGLELTYELTSLLL